MVEWTGGKLPWRKLKACCSTYSLLQNTHTFEIQRFILWLLFTSAYWSPLQPTEKDKILISKEEARKPEGKTQLLRNCPEPHYRMMMDYIDSLKYTSIPDYGYIYFLLKHIAKVSIWTMNIWNTSLKYILVFSKLCNVYGVKLIRMQSPYCNQKVTTSVSKVYVTVVTVNSWFYIDSLSLGGTKILGLSPVHFIVFNIKISVKWNKYQVCSSSI